MKENKTLAVLMVNRKDGTPIKRVAVLDESEVDFWSDLLGRGDWKTAMEKAGSVFRMVKTDEQIKAMEDQYTGQMTFTIPIIFGDEEDITQIDRVQDDDLKL